jgi:hypothetical protein
MDKAAEKRYRELPGEQKVKSAEAAAAEPWSPGTEIKKLVKEKLGMDNENTAKGIELKAGKPSSKKPYELKPEAKKKGGKVKCMARGGGIEVRGKTRGKIC